MIGSKDFFLDQQITEHLDRVERAKKMSKDERYTLRKFERFTKPKVKDGKTGTERLGK